MTEERAALASTITMLVSHELLGDFNIMQECHHEPNSDRLVFPATDNRPEITVALPLALIADRSRELVSNALSSYLSRLPHDARLS